MDLLVGIHVELCCSPIYICKFGGRLCVAPPDCPIIKRRQPAYLMVVAAAYKPQDGPALPTVAIRRRRAVVVSIRFANLTSSLVSHPVRLRQAPARRRQRQRRQALCLCVCEQTRAR